MTETERRNKERKIKRGERRLNIRGKEHGRKRGGREIEREGVRKSERGETKREK